MSVLGSKTMSDVPRPEVASPLHKSPVPRGSDAFQEALLQAYTDMKEKKKHDRKKSPNDDEGDDYSDEERDKCMDINLFRRFALSEHAAKLNPHFRGDRGAPLLKVPVRGVTTDYVSELDSSQKFGFKPSQGRRHSIATITPDRNVRKSTFHWWDSVSDAILLEQVSDFHQGNHISLHFATMFHVRKQFLSFLWCFWRM